MRIYIAASFTQRDTEATNMKRCLLAAGHEVTSRWLDPLHQKHNSYGMEDKFASMDLADIRRSEAMVIITEGDDKQTTKGGRHTELGIALERHIPIFLYGPKEQVFHNLLCVQQVFAISQLISALKRTVSNYRDYSPSHTSRDMLLLTESALKSLADRLCNCGFILPSAGGHHVPSCHSKSCAFVAALDREYKL